MEWLVLLIVVLVVLLVVVTLVGHGIWVLLAWMFRGPARPPAPVRAVPTRPVPPPIARRAAAPPADPWAITSACVGELFQAGLIDPTTFGAMDGAIQAHLARQARPAAQSAVPVAPQPIQAIEPAGLAEAVAAQTPLEGAAVVAVGDKSVPTAPPPAPPAAIHVPPPLPVAAEARPAPQAPRRFSPPPRPVREPSRPLSQVLASFMESSNIRWGELVGGLLIVGCSVALALSFWAEIAQRPLMKFSIFTAVTAALFALGLYSEHRWKLPTTSRGILLISTLLVPLNFLAFAAFSRGAPVADPIAIGGEAVAFILFSWLVWLSARVIAPQWPALLTAGMMALSVASLGVRYLSVTAGGAEVLTSGRMLALATAVVACYEVAGAGLALKARRWKVLDAAAADAVLLLLGALSFAALFPLVLIASRSGDDALHRLAPLLGSAGLPAITAGLLLWQRVQDPALRRQRVTGTGVAVLGAAVLLAGIALAWPDPAELLPAAGVAFAALLAVAVLLRLPIAHAPAVACAALAYLVGFHVLAGQVGWRSDSPHLLDVLCLPSGGAVLAGFVFLATAAAVVLRRRGWAADANVYFSTSMIAAVVSALLLAAGVVDGTGSAAVAAGVFGAYAVLWLGCALTGRTRLTSAFWMNAAQVCAAAAVTAAAVALRERAFPGRPQAVLADAVTWKAIGVALATLSLAWGVARRLVLRTRPAGENPDDIEVVPSEPSPLERGRALARLRFSFDHLIFGVVATVLAVAAISVAGLGIVVEFTPVGRAPGEVIGGPLATLATGPLPWLALALLVAANVLTALGAWRRRVAQAVLELSWIAVPLFAGTFSHPTASAGASALRWASGAYLLLGAAVVWWRGERGTPVDRAARGSNAISNLDALLLLFGVLPVAALSLYAAGSVLSGDVPAGPTAATVFASFGPAANYGLPLLVAAGVLVAQAVRRRSGGYAIGSLVTTNLLATTVYAVAFVNPAAGLGWAGLVRLVQLNIAVVGGFALAWVVLLALESRRRRRFVEPPRALGGVVTAALGLNVLLIVPAAGALFLLPASLPYADVGGAWGWAALGLAATSALSLLVVGRGRVSLGAAGAALAMGAAMAGLTAAARDHGNWLAYHTWIAAQTAAAWAMLGLGWWLHRRPEALEFHWERWEAEVPAETVVQSASPPEGPATPAAPPTLAYRTPGVEPRVTGDPGVRESAARWATALGSLSVLLALRAAFGDPAAPWPSVAAILFVAFLAAATAVWLRTPRGLYATGMLLNLAATIAYMFERGRLGGSAVMGLLEVNAAALALPAVAWLVLDLHLFRRPGAEGPGRRRVVVPFHRFAARVSAGLVSAVSVACIGRRLVDWPIETSAWLDAAAYLSVAALLLGCLWDKWAKAVPFLLYVFGLVAAAKVLDHYNVSPEGLGWFGALVLAGYTLLTSALWANRTILLRAMFGSADARPHAGAGALGDGPDLPLAQGIRAVAFGSGVGADRRGSAPWLSAANLFLALVVFALAVWADFAFASIGKRLGPAVAAAAQAASLDLLAGGAAAGAAVLASRLRSVALHAAVLGAVVLGWAFLDPAGDANGLKHAAVAAALTALVAVPVTLGLTRRRVTGDWPEAAQAAVPVLAFFCLASLAAAMALELRAQLVFGSVAMPAWAVAALAGVAAVDCAAAVALAVRRPPQSGEALVSSERGRAACVYLAEALLAVLFVHVRLTLPWLFHGYLRQYWPAVVMVIAFAGVGVGEVLRRRRWEVLGRPLQRTGAFLPLLPVLAWWVAASNVHYTALLALVGALYGLLAVLRRSTAFGLLAALAGNAGLWYLMHGSETVGFLVHPQLWIIPAALSVLAAIELNRRSLDAAEVRAGRYFCLVAVYLSSTADIFINGSAHSPWLPLVLAGLSVAGVLGGVTFRVRAFLFLGTAFLTLSLLAIIYNASASLHVTWIWYVAGIALGLFIIFLFALFEKKRATMLALVEGLKEWD